MRLLPDLRINHSIILSTQEPYTLNGRIIVEFQYGSFTIRCETDENIPFVIDIEDLKRVYIQTYNTYHGEIFRDENLNRQHLMHFDVYIDSIINQCEQLSRHRNTYTSPNETRYMQTCLERLNNQERYGAYQTLVDGLEITPDGIRRGNVFYSTDGSWVIGADTSGFASVCSNYSNATLPWCRPDIVGTNERVLINVPTNNSENSESPKKKYIHAYNYKPEYIKHYMPNEDNSSLLLGVEIEVAGNDSEPDREDTVKKCIQIMNKSDDDTEDLIYSTHDSTVQIELDTMPCTLNFHKTNMNYKELFKYLDKLRYKGHDCENAGLHIHADRNYLGKSELKQQLVITKILYILEKFNDEICVIARRNDYSKFVGKDEVNQTLDVLYKKYKDWGKKVALNLQHKETIEFRCFRSTLKYETFILTLEFVKDIIDYAKAINIEEIELIQWSDLMDTFSEDLKKYYNERLEVEKKKRETERKYYKIKVDAAYSSVNRNNSSINWPQSLCDTTNRISAEAFRTLCERVRITNTCDTLHELSNQVRTMSPSCNEYGVTTRNITIADFADGVYSLDANAGTVSENNPEKALKKEIKSLKKRIKNSPNYMERKRLNEELSAKQKELKRIMRQNSVSNSTNEH